MRCLIVIFVFALNLTDYSFAQCAFPDPRHIVSGGISFSPAEGCPFAIDSTGTVYVGQSADQSIINLGNGVTITGLGGFVAAYKSGNAIWSKKISSSFRCRILDIQVDKNKNVFVCGAFCGNISVDSYNASGSSVCYQAFVLKMDSLHTCQWLRVSSGNNTTNVSSTDDDEGRYIAPDENGGCYVSIYYKSFFTLGATVFSTNWGVGVTNSVVAHYGSTGTLNWARGIYSVDGTTKAPIIVTDYNGGAYLIHYLGTACPLDTATIFSSSQRTVYVMHIDLAAHYDNWVNKLYNAWWTYQYNPSWINSARCMNDGTLLLAGEFRDSVLIDTFRLYAPGVEAVYFAHIGLNGQTDKFDKLATCLNSVDEVSLGQDGIDILPDGGVYMSGILFGSADFNGILRDDVQGSIYAVRYDSLLQPIWCRTFGGVFPGFGHYHPYGIRTTPCGTSVVSGLFSDPITIFPVLLSPPFGCNHDFYLAEFDSADGSTYSDGVGINETVLSEDYSIFPNPATDFIEVKINYESAFDNVAIYDVTGKCVANVKPIIQNEETFKLNISLLQPGFYFIKSINEKSIPQPFIKL